MEQEEIRPYNGQQFTVTEGAEIVEELHERTKHDDTEYNSIGQLGVKVKALEESVFVDNKEKFITNKFTLSAVNDDATPLTSVPAGQIGIDYNVGDDNVSAFLFNQAFSMVVGQLKELVSTFVFYIQIYNHTTDRLDVTKITSFQVEANTYLRAIIDESISNDFLVGDIVDFLIFHSENNNNSSYPETIDRTGATIQHDVPAVYNRLTPISGDLTLSDTNFKAGVSSSCYHKSTTFPSISVPSGKTRLFNPSEYVADGISLNVIWITSIPGGNYEVNVKVFPETYEPELQQTINTANSNSDQIPSTLNLFKINNFIKGLKELALDSNASELDNVIGVIDSAYVFVNSTREFSKYNLITGQKVISENGTGLTYSLQGFKGSTTGMLLVDSLASLANYSKDNSCVYILEVHDSSPVAGYVLGVIEDGDTSSRLQIGDNGIDTRYLGINDDGNVFSDSVDNGSIMLDRSSATEFQLFKDGNLVSIISEPSTAVPIKTLGLLARNFGSGNVASNGSNSTIQVLIQSSSLKDYANEIDSLVKNTLL